MTNRDNEDRGVRCPKCGSPWSIVLETRRLWGKRNRRRRVCKHCGQRFTTVERTLKH